MSEKDIMPLSGPVSIEDEPAAKMQGNVQTEDSDDGERASLASPGHIENGEAEGELSNAENEPLPLNHAAAEDVKEAPQNPLDDEEEMEIGRETHPAPEEEYEEDFSSPSYEDEELEEIERQQLAERQAAEQLAQEEADKRAQNIYDRAHRRPVPVRAEAGDAPAQAFDEAPQQEDSYEVRTSIDDLLDRQAWPASQAAEEDSGPDIEREREMEYYPVHSMDNKDRHNAETHADRESGQGAPFTSQNTGIAPAKIAGQQAQFLPADEAKEVTDAAEGASAGASSLGKSIAKSASKGSNNRDIEEERRSQAKSVSKAAKKTLPAIQYLDEHAGEKDVFQSRTTSVSKEQRESFAPESLKSSEKAEQEKALRAYNKESIGYGQITGGEGSAWVANDQNKKAAGKAAAEGQAKGAFKQGGTSSKRPEAIVIKEGDKLRLSAHGSDCSGHTIKKGGNGALRLERGASEGEVSAFEKETKNNRAGKLRTKSKSEETSATKEYYNESLSKKRSIKIGRTGQELGLDTQRGRMRPRRFGQASGRPTTTSAASQRMEKMNVGRAGKVKTPSSGLSMMDGNAKKASADSLRFRRTWGIGADGASAEAVQAPKKMAQTVAKAAAKKVATISIASTLVFSAGAAGQAKISSSSSGYGEMYYLPQAHIASDRWDSSSPTFTQNALTRMDQRLNAYQAIANGNTPTGDEGAISDLKNIPIATAKVNGNIVDPSGHTLASLKGASLGGNVITSVTVTYEFDDAEGKPLEKKKDEEGNRFLGELTPKAYFFKEVLAMSALGGYSKSPGDEKGYDAYCYGIMDYALSGWRGADITVNGGTCNVTVHVCTDLKTLEENDPIFAGAWDIEATQYGDALPFHYMQLEPKVFDLIFNINTASFFGGSMLSGVEKEIYDFFARKGLGNVAISAILANVSRESSFDSACVNKESGASGLFQWTDDRLSLLKKYTKSKGCAWTDVHCQLEFAWAEMSGDGSIPGVEMQWSKSLWNEFSSTDNPFEAGVLFGRCWERYGDENEDNERGKLAKKYYLLLMSGGGTGSITGDPDFSNMEAWGLNNPYSAAGLYGQCTWFAWGRFYEIYGYSPGFTDDGYLAADLLVAAHPDKFEISSTPKVGAVFSSIGENHTGIVTGWDGTYITIQDGNYNHKTDTFEVAKTDWQTNTYPLEQFVSMYGGMKFANPK